MKTKVKYGFFIAGDGTIRKETIVSGFESEYEMWEYYHRLPNTQDVTLSRISLTVTLKAIWVPIAEYLDSMGWTEFPSVPKEEEE